MKIIERFVTNKSFRPTGAEISCIVVHATGMGTIEGAISWFNNPKSEVSSHYIIDINGDVYYCVNEINKAWHAGYSEFEGRDNVNTFSIGIELHNTGGLYPQEQIDALTELCVEIFKKYPKITLTGVVRHADVALPKGRKVDPERLDWAQFKFNLGAALKALGGSNGI